MPKERNYNPVQAQRKAEKAKAIKRAEQQARRNEKLARRNPAKIQQQIDDLKAIKQGGGKLTSHEEQALEALEKDLKAVLKAREALGDKAPQFGRGPPRQGQRGEGVLGKRRRDAEDASSSDSDVPEDVKSIPMPRDTPPPIPKEILDQWYAKRRAKRNADRAPGSVEGEPEKPAAPVVESKTVYEAKPIVRDLRKEAVSAFVPTAVRMKIEKSKGRAGLLEPEEADKLEKDGYLRAPEATTLQAQPNHMPSQEGGPRQVTMEEVEDEG
ncbi:WW domain binding protein 11-domain-containing protein [Chaetomium strumarium]|uniref:WW domain binding protein 11-domain-containing protein n=1 Tax=Chaetomium strumarium TaxID=1170767 RepID=A0AAJ0H415_9PEZI|nr:WW domain binding protein 11-domain-containing protein [Chaetomium strumarium]